MGPSGALRAALVCAALACSVPPTEEPILWRGAEWLDDWFALERIDAHTFAIGEPRYWQYNLNYLIVGEARAVLLDSGPGERDIAEVVARLTSQPVTAAFSHAHFDHIGNHERFESVALIDLPCLRERVEAGVFRPSLAQHLTPGRPEFRVTEWWKPGGIVDLGGRRLEVISIPGHTPESMALFDAERGQLFTGDFIYPGELFAFTPGADLEAYLASARRLIERTGGDEILYGGHAAPRLPRAALTRLERVLAGILDGSGAWSRVWFSVLPLRRYALGDIAVLTPAFPDPASRARSDRSHQNAETNSRSAQLTTSTAWREPSTLGALLRSRAAR